MPSTVAQRVCHKQRYVEKYTPDSAVGRMIFSIVSGPIAGFSLLLSVGFLYSPVMPSVLTVPVTGSVGVALGILTAFVLWPVYLSVIGNVPAPSAYAEPVQASSFDVANNVAEHRAGENVALQRLRERYATGELSEEAFEKRVESLVATEVVDHTHLNKTENTSPTENHAKSHQAPAADSRGETR